MRCFCLLPFWLCFIEVSESQIVSRLRGEVQYGFIISHAPDLKPLSANYPYGFSLSYQQMVTSQKHWNACNCFHYLGAKFSYINYGDSHSLGEAYAFSGTFEPVLWRNNSVSLSLFSGVGASWLTRIHHPENNPLNQFFSARMSFLLSVAPVLEYNFSPHWSLHLALNYNHISNGGQRQPNRGMNFPQLGVGVSYNLRQAELPSYPKLEPDGVWHGWIEAGYTTRKTGDAHVRRPVFSIAGGFYHPFTSINAAGFGVEFSDDYSIRSNTSDKKYTLAPFVSHHLLLGRFDFSQRLAYYVIKPDDVASYGWYQRYALLFNATKRLNIGFSMKTHGHVAANLDLRVAWLF